MIRNVIQAALASSPTITAVARGGVRHTQNCETSTPKPFVAWRLGDGDLARGIGGVRVGELIVFCHDEPGDLGNVDKLLYAAIEAAEGAKGPGEDGSSYLSTVEFLSATGDRYDQFFQSVVRSATFRVVGRGI